MAEIKAIETVYKGYRFRSRLEARWAVFFDACGIKWEYEPEGFDLGDGISYLPDFLLHGVSGRSTYDLWVEVKGVMTKEDEKKIRRFHKMIFENSFPNEYAFANCRQYPKNYKGIYVVGNLPQSDTFWEIISEIGNMNYNNEAFYSFEMIDTDNYTAIPSINTDGDFELLGPDYTEYMDEEATVEAFRKAKQARFEHGESPQTALIGGNNIMTLEKDKVTKAWNALLEALKIN